jgi:hypothetical protein
MSLERRLQRALSAPAAPPPPLPSGCPAAAPAHPLRSTALRQGGEQACVARVWSVVVWWVSRHRRDAQLKPASWLARHSCKAISCPCCCSPAASHAPAELLQHQIQQDRAGTCGCSWCRLPQTLLQPQHSLRHTPCRTLTSISVVQPHQQAKQGGLAAAAGAWAVRGRGRSGEGGLCRGNEATCRAARQ